jgi:CheY-like chemotaxis protein
LSDQLSKNPDGNLSARQTEFAKTIHSSGNDLLTLINDILDLSKIESGTVVVDASDLRLDDLRSFVERTFRHVAESKSVDFVVHFDPRLPKSMFTDAKRLQQIIKNLLSNAFKFTHHGQVTLTVEPVAAGWSPSNEELNRAAMVLAFEVTDTGIGIPPDKQQIIFEAFQQADGSTSRKYGGTGLGLAISRELSRLLGGEIRLSSAPARGSEFTLYLPINFPAQRPQRKTTLPEPAESLTAAARLVEGKGNGATGGNGHLLLTAPAVETSADLLVNEVGDDRDEIASGDKTILIVENDLGFARFLLDTVRERGYKGLVTSLGAVALELTREYKPTALTLDIHLPDIDGWRVLERLKHDIQMRHLPVCVISTDDARQRALDSGAFVFIAKPVQSRDVLDELLTRLDRFLERETRNVLVLEPNERDRRRIIECLSAEDVEVLTAADSESAVAMLHARPIDCVVTGTVDRSLVDWLASRQSPAEGGANRLPVVVFGEEAESGDSWRRVADTCTVRHTQSLDRLLDVTSLFLHRNLAALPETKRRQLVDLHQSDRALADKKVLIVDDDMRNIFALSTVLEDHNMRITSADNGRDAIHILQRDHDVDIVLMDIMMPEMDGMETIREIRKIPRLKNLPIIAVTAKAMKGDREKCIEAGAWDYLSKPVDTELMLAALRGWLHR